MKKHTFLLGILLSSTFAVAGWLFDAGWLRPFTIFFAERSSQIPLLALAIVAAILALEYRTWFLCHSEQVSLLPKPWQRKKILELAATSVLTLATIALFAQLIAKVYAMSFTLFSSSTEVTETNSVAAGDFDGDGDIDYVVGYTDGSSFVYFYTNDGNGSYTKSDIGLGFTGYKGFALGDINGDGRLDFVSADGPHKFIKNVGSGFDQANSDISSTLSILLFDVDNDGDLDGIGGQSSQNTNGVCLNDGLGTFTCAVSTIPESEYIAAADFNSDGYMDIVSSDALINQTEVLLNDGTGQFSSSYVVSPAPVYGGQVAVGDLDGDGDIDFLALTGGAGSIKPYLNGGAGTSFTAGTTFGSVTSTYSIALGDLDNDGDLDVILGGNDSAGLNAGDEIYLNDGNGVFSQSGTPTEEDDCTKEVAMADIENDGDLDYIAGNEECGAGTSGRAHRIYKNDQAATSANTAPAAPTSDFSTAKISSGGGTATIRLTWGSGSDSQTSTRMLQYVVRAGTGSLYNNTISGTRGVPAYTSRLMPNGQSRTFLLKDFPCGKSLFWSVATVDSGLKTSSFSSEQEFGLNTDCSVTSQTPLFYWKFDEGPSGLTATDYSGNGATMTLANHGWSSSGASRIQFSNPYSLSLGDTTEGQAAGVSYITGIQKFTQSVWMKTSTKPSVGSSLGHFHNIVMMATGGQGTGGFDKGLSITTSGTADFYVYDGGRVHVSGGADLADNAWHHLVGTYDGARVRLYVDGTYIGALDAVSTANTSQYIVVNFFGTAETEGYYSGDMFSGAIDDLRIYDRTLSQSEVTNIWNGCSGTISCSAAATPTGDGGVASFVKLLRDKAKKEEEEAAQRGMLKGTVYLDVNRSGIKDERETLGIADVTVKIKGTSAFDESVDSSTLTNTRGEFSFSLPPTDSDGYTISLDTTAASLDNYRSTTDTLTGGILISANGTTTFNFGWQRKQQALAPVSTYRPCLVIGPGDIQEDLGESEQLLMRLIDPYDKPMMEGLTLERTLVSRGSFIDLLSRVQCEPLPSKPDEFSLLLKSIQATYGENFPKDFEPSMNDTKSLRALLTLKQYSEFPRIINGEKYLDIRSPISRKEALELTFAILSLSASGSSVTQTGSTLPFDISSSDTLAATYLKLKELKVLPESFWPILAPHAGLSVEDAAAIAVKVAFIKGKIGILPTLEEVKEEELHSAAEEQESSDSSVKQPTYIPELPKRSCLISDRKRSMSLTFTDILPGDALSDDLSLLLPLGTKNMEEKTLWLLSGQADHEYGVGIGRLPLKPNEIISIVELLRALEVLTCNPPRTSADVMENPTGTIAGSAMNLNNRERIANLDRTDTSLASRVLFGAQDHERAFDLSLLKFAPHIIRDEYRSPKDTVSLKEAADIIASALLYIQVKEQKISPQDAAFEAQGISLAILEKLAGRSLDWRNTLVMDETPLKRGQLISALAAIMRESEEEQSNTEATISSGEQWWQRLWPSTEPVLKIDPAEEQKMKSAAGALELQRWAPPMPIQIMPDGILKMPKDEGALTNPMTPSTPVLPSDEQAPILQPGNTPAVEQKGSPVIMPTPENPSPSVEQNPSMHPPTEAREINQPQASITPVK